MFVLLLIKYSQTSDVGRLHCLVTLRTYALHCYCYVQVLLLLLMLCMLIIRWKGITKHDNEYLITRLLVIVDIIICVVWFYTSLLPVLILRWRMRVHERMILRDCYSVCTGTRNRTSCFCVNKPIYCEQIKQHIFFVHLYFFLPSHTAEVDGWTDIGWKISWLDGWCVGWRGLISTCVLVRLLSVPPFFHSTLWHSYWKYM